MDEFMGLSFKVFTEDDIPGLSVIMKEAFDEDTRIHLGKEHGGPPGYDDGSFMRKWYLKDGVSAYTILKDGKQIGAMALWINGDNVNYLGNIFISPEYQRQGVGTNVWKYVEQKYPGTLKWKTDTPGFSRRNHAFYVNKCGFHIVKITNSKDLLQASYHMEKII